MAQDKRKNVPLFTQIKQMGPAFWIANTSEAMERLAFFGVRAVLPLYMYGPMSVLQFSMTEKGLVYLVWAWIQCMLPMISGGYTDSYGYRKSLVVAFVLNACGYVLMGNVVPIAGDSHMMRFWIMMLAAIFVGTGTAVFKPPVQGRVAKSLNEGNSGLGFGIFYWLVNVGAFFAPMGAAWARGDELNPTWHQVFYGAALVTFVNLVFCLLFFREPEIDQAAKNRKPLRVFVDTIVELWRDQAMFRFLLVVSGFWFMFMQLWDLLPNFIDEWVDCRDVGAILTGVLGDWANSFLTVDGAAKPEVMINIDALTILIFVLPLSWLFGRFKMMTALVIGMILALIGFVSAGMTMVGNLVAIFIFVFAIGEIICSPKFSEFVGMSAPPDKKAQYMGYSNIPFAFGWGIGNAVSGPLYDTLSSKVALTRRYLIEEIGMPADTVGAIEQEDLMSTLLAQLGGDIDAYQATEILWHQYHPWTIWVILGTVGVVSIIGMIWNHRKSAQRRQVA